MCGVHLLFDARELRLVDRVGLAEVEAQPIGSDQRTRPGGRASPRMRRNTRVQRCGGGVIEACRLAPFAVDAQAHPLARREAAAYDGADVHDQVGSRSLRVGDLDHGATGGLDGAAVADLSARFAVEGRLGGDDLHRVAFARLARLFAVDRQGGDLRLELVDAVADEARGRVGGDHGRTLDAELARVAGALRLRLHARRRSPSVSTSMPSARRMSSVMSSGNPYVSYRRKATSPARARRRRPSARRSCVEQRQALVESLGEALLLAANRPLRCEARRSRELGIGFAHGGDHRLAHAVEEGLVEAEHLGVAGGAAQDAAQHVAAPVVGRHDAVGDHEVQRAAVVGDDAHRQIVLSARLRSARPDCFSVKRIRLRSRSVS